MWVFKKHMPRKTFFVFKSRAGQVHYLYIKFYRIFGNSVPHNTLVCGTYALHSFEHTTFCDLRIALFKDFLWSSVGSASTLHFYGMIGLIITRFHVLYCRKHVVDSDKLSQTLLADWMSYWKNTREVLRNPGNIIKH